MTFQCTDFLRKTLEAKEHWAEAAVCGLSLQEERLGHRAWSGGLAVWVPTPGGLGEVDP